MTINEVITTLQNALEAGASEEEEVVIYLGWHFDPQSCRIAFGVRQNDPGKPENHHVALVTPEAARDLALMEKGLELNKSFQVAWN